MAYEQNPVKATQTEVVHVHLKITAADAVDATIVEGVGVKDGVRQGEGVYRIRFFGKYSALVGVTYGLQAATPADLKGYTVVADTLDTTTDADYYFVELTVYNSSFAAADLLANQWVYVDFAFRNTSVTTG